MTPDRLPAAAQVREVEDVGDGEVITTVRSEHGTTPEGRPA